MRAMSMYIAAIRGDRAPSAVAKPPRDEVPLRPIRPGAFASWIARMEAREADLDRRTDAPASRRVPKRV
ncbi:MAG TPA: hypothetical protein VD763_13920 [Candidatus Saccharimonadales bacterium]|nr:hypothetical protein [Candidatus Saccharimonadales bacterium]